MIQNVHPVFSVRTEELVGTTPVAVRRDMVVCSVEMTSKSVAVTHVSMEVHVKMKLGSTDVNAQQVSAT